MQWRTDTLTEVTATVLDANGPVRQCNDCGGVDSDTCSYEA